MQFVRYYYDFQGNSTSASTIVTQAAKAMPAYIETASDWYQGDKYFTRREGRDDYYLLYTISGSGTVSYRGRSFTLEPGKACLLYCMEPHYYATMKDEVWHIIFFHINGAAVKNYFSFLYGKDNFFPIFVNDDAAFMDTYDVFKNLVLKYDALSLSRQSLAIQSLLHTVLAAKERQAPEEEKVLPDWFLDVRGYIESRREHDLTITEIAKVVGVTPYELENKFRLYEGKELADYIKEMREDYNKGKDARMKLQNPPWVLEASSYIDQHYNEKINFAELAKSLHVSQPVFFRNFRRCMCDSPTNILLKRRLRAGIIALDTTDDSITTISNNVGFSSPSEFSKKFKEWVGMTPKEYRANIVPKRRKLLKGE